MDNQILDPLLNGCCDKCIYRGVYPDEGDENNPENWFCSVTKLIIEPVPCTHIRQCGDFMEDKLIENRKR